MDSLPERCTHVVTLWDDERDLPPLPPATLTTARRAGKEPARHVVRVRDVFDADLRSHFDACCAFLSACAAAGGVAYVHCQMGRSRSATVTIAFLMRRYAVSLRVAYAHVAMRRDVYALNYGFLAQLNDEEAALASARSSLPAAHVPTLPLPLYFLALERTHSTYTALRQLTREAFATSWRKISTSTDEERHAGPAIERLVHGVWYVCKSEAGKSAHCADVLRLMADAPDSDVLWGGADAADAAE